MATNPNVAQGTLNKLRASMIWSDFPELNVTPAFLSDDMFRLTFEGDSTVYIDTATGAVTSQEPYLKASVRMPLLRTQALADAYKQKMESDSQMGEGTLRPDSRTMSPWQLVNCSIMNVEPLDINGKQAAYVVSIKGYYNINSGLWNL